MTERIWTCKIGGDALKQLPRGADWPMRRAVQEMFAELLDVAPTFCFSGWGGELTEGERAVVENREPQEDPTFHQSPVGAQGGVSGRVSCTEPVCANTPKPRPTFVKALEELINSYSMERGSKTPDFVLAQYLQGCLINYNQATQAREAWGGVPEAQPPGSRKYL